MKLLKAKRLEPHIVLRLLCVVGKGKDGAGVKLKKRCLDPHFNCFDVAPYVSDLDSRESTTLES